MICHNCKETIEPNSPTVLSEGDYGYTIHPHCKIYSGTMTETAESVALRYDYIGKLDFLKEVKEIEGSIHIKQVLAVWNKYYAD